MTTDTLETTCCVVGGGPAGMMLGYLLARKGVRVTVLEKHGDFSAISGVTRCILPRSRFFANLDCSVSFFNCRISG